VPLTVPVYSIWFHAAILDIFRPFVVDEKHHGFKAWTPVATSPEAIFAASVRQLKRLILTFKSQHKSAGYSIFWHAALLYIATAVLKDKKDPGRRFYFMICVKSYQALFVSFQFVECIVEGLLVMALDVGVISVKEANHIMQEFHAQRRTHQRSENMCAEERVRNAFILDRDLALRDRQAAIVDNLVEKFEEITLFD
jgi:hypothetical protein